MPVASPFALFSPRRYLLVADLSQNAVLRYDIASGDFVDAFIKEGKPDQVGTYTLRPFDIQRSPDGWLHVLTLNPREVWRYRQGSGAFAGVVVPDLETKDENWRQAFCTAFGPKDENLYLATHGPLFGAGAEVMRYQGKTGAPLGMFVTTKSGGLDGAACIAFGPDGHLYAAGDETEGILRFDGTTGAFLNALVPSHPHASSINPRSLAFGPDGNLYALARGPRQAGESPAYTEPDRVLRYDGTTGALLGEFIGPSPQLGHPTGIVFGPDGTLYVATSEQLVRHPGPVYFHSGRILVYNGATGAFIRTLDPSGHAGLGYPISMTFATVPISIREIIFRSRIPRWMWVMGIGVVLGAAAGHLLGPAGQTRGLGAPQRR